MGNVCRLFGDVRPRLRVRHEHRAWSRGYRRRISQRSFIWIRIRHIPEQSRTLCQKTSERSILPLAGPKVLGYETDAEDNLVLRKVLRGDASRTWQKELEIVPFLASWITGTLSGPMSCCIR